MRSGRTVEELRRASDPPGSPPPRVRSVLHQHCPPRHSPSPWTGHPTPRSDALVVRPPIFNSLLDALPTRQLTREDPAYQSGQFRVRREAQSDELVRRQAPDFALQLVRQSPFQAETLLQADHPALNVR